MHYGIRIYTNGTPTGWLIGPRGPYFDKSKKWLRFIAQKEAATSPPGIEYRVEPAID